MVYFIADAHLGARYVADPKAHERSLVDALRQMEADATDLYLMGDMLDFWFEWRHVAPRGHVRFFGQLARMADSGIRLHWIRGNHDMWISDYLPAEIGIEVITGPVTRTIMGKRFLLDHGDSIGERPRSFKLLQTLFRSKTCRRLLATVHPRWTMALALGWSSSSRKTGCDMPVATDLDSEPLVKYARLRAADAAAGRAEPVDFIVAGHRHAVIDTDAGYGTRLIVPGDWLRHFTCAAFDGSVMRIITPPRG